MYIVIEGPIGSGKTSLTNLISDHLGCKSLFEIVEENPFLEKFYSDPDKWAFKVEMFFLTHRYVQLETIKEEYLDKKASIVSDYDIYKNLIFAQKNLSGYQNKKFESIFNILTNDLPEPDLYIFIKAPLGLLQERISRRGRDFEKDISSEYLNYLINSYEHYHNKLIEQKKEVIVLDAEKIDFVNNSNDREKTKQIIDERLLSHDSTGEFKLKI